LTRFIECVVTFVLKSKTMKKFRLAIIMLLLTSFAMSCASNKTLCEKKKVRPADVWYKGNNSNKVYR